MPKSQNFYYQHLCYEQFHCQKPLSGFFRKVNKQLRVNKQLTHSKILNFHSKHLCLEQFQCQKPLSDFFVKVNNQLKVNKQLTILKIQIFHSKHLGFEQFQCQKLLSGFFKSKQSAESKQTADHLKNSKLTYLTTFYCISVVISQCQCPWQPSVDDG